MESTDAKKVWSELIEPRIVDFFSFDKKTELAWNVLAEDVEHQWQTNVKKYSCKQTFSNLDAIYTSVFNETENALSKEIAGQHLTEYVQKKSMGLPKIFAAKDSVLQKIFTEHPPTELTDVYQTSHQELFSTFTPREIASIVRHTEKADWQNVYLKKLSKLERDDFEYTSLHIHFCDYQPIKQAIESAGKEGKPWRISHSKEAGVITCFDDQDQSFIHPNIMFWLILCHYIREIINCSTCIDTKNSGTLKPGKNAVNIITTCKHTLGELTPCAFSEDIFWREGFELFQEMFPHINISFYLDMYDTYFYDTDTQKLVVTNPIDFLWNKNLYIPSDSSKSIMLNGNYVYHGRESLFGILLRNIAQMDQKTYRSYIIDHLDQNDKAIFDQLSNIQ